MLTKILKYKGYQGTVEVDFDNNRLSGKVLHVKSLITYCGDSPGALRASFEEEIDEYIADCKTLGVEPEKPCSGTFQVRTSPEVHKYLLTQAVLEGVTFNKYVNQILEREFRRDAHSPIADMNWKLITFQSIEQAVSGIDPVKLKLASGSIERPTEQLFTAGSSSKPKLEWLTFDKNACH